MSLESSHKPDLRNTETAAKACTSEHIQSTEAQDKAQKFHINSNLSLKIVILNIILI